MYKFCALFVSLLAISAANGGKLPKPEEPSPLLTEMIYEANLDIAKQNKSIVNVADFSLNYLIGKISLKNSLAGNFSSVALVGEDQVFNQTELAEGGTVYHFDVNLGLEDLYIESDLYYSFLIPFVNSRVKISERNLGLRVAGSIYSMDLDKCNATLDTAEVTGLGDFEVTFTPSGITTYIPKHLIQFFLNHIAPMFKFYVNSKINTIVQEEEVKSQFVAKACEPFLL